MRKTFATIAVLVLISTLALAQTTTQKQPATGSQSGMSGMHHPAGHQGMMGGNMQQHMQQMKAALEEMKQNLDAMKADTAKMDNEAGRDYMEKNNELWQKMVDHLSMMMDQMGSMHGAPAGGAMHHGSTASPKQPATKPPQK